MLSEKLAGSKFADADYLNDIMEEFERKTKRKFDGTQNSIIRFGKDWDNDRAHGIVKGRLTLSKEDVATAFNAVIPRIISSVSNLLDGRKVEVCHRIWSLFLALTVPSAASVARRRLGRIPILEKDSEGYIWDEKCQRSHRR